MVNRTEAQTGGFQPVTSGYWLMILGEKATKQLHQSLMPFDINPLQFGIMNICAQNGASTITQMGQYLAFDTSAISRHAERLCVRDLLNRTHSTEDRRVAFLELTDEGKALFDQLQEAATVGQEELLSAITEGERTTLVGISRKLVESIEQRQRAAAAED